MLAGSAAVLHWKPVSDMIARLAKFGSAPILSNPAPHLSRSCPSAPSGAVRSASGVRQAARPTIFCPAFTAILLALLPMFGLTAEAQTRVLVSTIVQSNAAQLVFPGSPIASTAFGLIDHGQRFTTGSNADGYRLDSVEILFGQIATGLTYTARIRQAGTSGPGNTVGTLTTPSFSTSATDQTLSFAAPAGGIALAASTDYFLVLEVSGTRTNQTSTWRNTLSDDEDSTGLSDWSVNNDHIFRLQTGTNLNWQDNLQSSSLKFRINGEALKPTLAITDASATEGAAITFTVNRSGATGAAATVKWNTADDSTEGANGATAGSDYTAVTTARTLTFAIGDTEKTLTVATTQDVVHEGDETFLVQLSDPTGATITDAEGTGTITDDDAAPTALTLTVDADTGTQGTQTAIAENGGARTVRVTATLGGATTFATATTVGVTVGASSDSAREGTDYETVADQTITIPAGQASAHADFTLTPGQDVLAEGTETITLGGTAAGLTVTGTQISLTDDDAAPTGITLAVSPISIDEDDGATGVTVTATVDGATRFATEQTITVSVGGGTATSGTDYTAVADFAIAIAAGAATGTGTFTLTPNQDAVHEGDETIDVTGTAGTITVNRAVLSLTDDDVAPTLAITDASATEGAAITFTVNRSGATGAAATVKWNTADDSTEGANGATAGSDYTAVTTARTLTFAIGDTEKTLTVATTQDVVHEGDETFLVQLSDPTGATITDAEGTGTITDDDAAPTGITLAVSPISIDEDDGATGVTVTATVDGATRFATEQTITVSVGGGTATSGTDYTAVADFAIAIAAGAATGTGTFTLTPNQDAVHEGDETIDVTGTAGTITVNRAVLSLTDDDVAPTLAITDASATEGAAITFTVNRSGATGAAATVKWNTADDSTEGANGATAGSDYTAVTTARTLTFAIGDTEKTLTVATTQDVVHEGDETFLVQLSDPTGATITDAEGTGTITDDDAAPTALTLTVDADTGTQGTQTAIAENGGARTVRVTATLGGATTFATATTVGVTVGASSDSAREGTDYETVADQTITIPAGQASAHADFTLTPGQDVLAEGTETITLGGTAAGLTVTGTQISLTDDDAAPTGITLAVSPISIDEDDGATGVTVTATVDGATRFATEQTITVSVGGGTATSGTDYTAVADFAIAIAAGAATGTGTFTLTPNQDAVHEGDETIDVTGTAGTITVNRAVLSLTDDDPLPGAYLSRLGRMVGSQITDAIFDRVREVQAAQTERKPGLEIILGGQVLPQTTFGPDDATPAVSPISIDEDDGATGVTVTATVDGATRFATEQTITVSVGGGTATSGTDYTAVALRHRHRRRRGHRDRITPNLRCMRATRPSMSPALRITVNRAVLSLTDDDPLPGAYLSRLGRMVGSQITDAIFDRVREVQAAQTERKPGLEIILGGQVLPQTTFGPMSQP